MKIGERISELRKDKGFKQKDIASKLNVAISTISNYETNCHEPDLTNLCKLADMLDVTTDYLLGRTELNIDLNTLKEPIDSHMTKADLLQILEYFSKDDYAYLVKTIRLLYYQYHKPSSGDTESEKKKS